MDLAIFQTYPISTSDRLPSDVRLLNMAAEAQRIFVNAVANSRPTLVIEDIGITVRIQPSM